MLQYLKDAVVPTINDNVVYIAAPVFGGLLFLAWLRMWARAARGRAYLRKLSSLVEAIQAQFLIPDSPSAKGLAARLDEALEREKARNHPDLAQAIVELRNNLITYADNLSAQSGGRIVAHVRVADVFSAQLPGRFLATGRAMAASRFSVQAGLACSVFFILLAILSLDSNINDVTKAVASKFAFTILGLVASLGIQLTMERFGREARQLFVNFEDALEAETKRQVVSPLAGSFRVLEQQVELTKDLGQILVGFKEQIKALSDGAADLGRSADAASQTLKVAQQASQSIGTEIETRLAALLDRFGKAQEAFLASLDEHAGKATQQYSRAIGVAASKFDEEATTAGTSFKTGMNELGSELNRLIVLAGSSLQQNVSTASDRLGATAAQAGTTLETGVTAALSRFSGEFTSAAKTYSEGALTTGNAAVEAVRLLTVALGTLKQALGGAQEQFKQFGDLQIDRLQETADSMEQRFKDLVSKVEKMEVGHIERVPSPKPAERPAAPPPLSNSEEAQSLSTRTRPSGSDGQRLE